MIDTLRQWHWNLLHRVFGIPDRNHTAPGASLSTVLHSHPPVPAHGQRFAQPKQPTLQSQLERERQREPRVLKNWQRRIGDFFACQSEHRSES
jgi:hypothetical protein